MSFSVRFLAEVEEVARLLDAATIERMASLLVRVRERSGRLFILGVGGSAGNASHAVNDFRKLVGIETYAPTDNVSELTARANDEGWPTVFEAWLRVSHLQPRDAILVLSVGGGSVERNVSPNIVAALDYAKSVGASVLGIVGRDGGYTARVADVCVIIPTVHPDRITPHSEAFQAIVWHLLVSHPALQQNATKWESITPAQSKRGVFLDRDGVLNEAVVRDGMPYPPADAASLRILAGTAEALARLKERGYLLLVVTNQPDVARGNQSRDAIEEMNRRLRAELPVDAVLTCYHDDADDCDCRKPRPGLIKRAAQQYEIDLGHSYLIGDRWRDIDAGANAGCKTILIDRRYSERAPATAPDVSVGSLSDAVDWILKNNHGERVRSITELKIKLFADGADKAQILQAQANPLIRGFTTNPTLMRAAGVKNYEAFAHEILKVVIDRPISFEVFADEFDEMGRQAHKIASWAENVYVKIPVTNARRESSMDLIQRLAHSGVKVNVTAILTLDQVRDAAAALAGGAPSVVSVFAGRIADTGADPVPIMAEAVKIVTPHAGIELLWASPRELLNIFQANDVGCHIITATDSVLSKLKVVGKNLDDYSLETVQMFYNDANKSGYNL